MRDRYIRCLPFRCRFDVIAFPEAARQLPGRRSKQQKIDDQQHTNGPEEVSENLDVA